MAQSEERVIWKGFGKNVSLLHVSGNIADIDGVPDESLEMMIFQRDVLGPWCQFGSHSHLNARLIVFEDFAEEVWLVNVQRKYPAYLFH